MQETAESVKEYGVPVPALARPREDGGYELIAGHRRKHACELAGLATMPVIVRDIDRDAATIIMVDSNLQRENIYRTEEIKNLVEWMRDYNASAAQGDDLRFYGFDMQRRAYSYAAFDDRTGYAHQYGAVSGHRHGVPENV